MLFGVFKSDIIEESADFQKSPQTKMEASVLSPLLPALAQTLSSDSGKNQPTSEGPDLSIIQNSALLSSSNPQGVMSDNVRDLITTYVVKGGDNLSAIANSFGVTVNTILWTNNIRDARLIKPGDTLIILPISGVTYTVKKGDSLELIAKRFKSSSDDIAQFNGLAIDEVLTVGTEIIIPDGEQEILSQPQSAIPSSSRPPSVVSRFANLPDLTGYFMRPIIGGRNSRASKSNPHGLHGYNGVDLASSCGMPVMASAEGVVIITRSSGWNGGYGRYVVISHPNGTQTLYGHLRTVDVSPGQSVVQGKLIGTIGSSGNSTGCHVHFEIRGAKNNF